MNSRSNIQNELVALNSDLSPYLHMPVFGLPEGYFENFAALMLQKLKEEEALSPADELFQLSPLLASVPKKSPYHVPENYFSQIKNDLPAFVGNDALPEMLHGLNRKPTFEVPAGYFENFARFMLNKVAPKTAKVIPMRARWMRMAAAAVIAGIITVGSFLYLKPPAQTTAATGEGWVATNLKGVSDKELEEFVQSAKISGDDVAHSGAPATEVKALLSDVSTKEMDAFLAQVPTDDEELLIIN